MSVRIVVGLSGGVDSALAAALLQARGFDVVGCFLKVAIPDVPCPWREDVPMAHRVAAHLGIPLIIRDVSTEYAREVLTPMIAAYRIGETPNPDATCNRWVKFDALAAVAREVGAERIATGHYARLRGVDDTVELHRGIDHVKDQSYFLWQLTQDQLAKCEFPIGGWRKDDVRAEAKRRGFPNWDRASTSGVCFLGDMDLSQFLASHAVATPAAVVTTTGAVVGGVPSAEAMTIGQRAPIAGQPSARYVVATAPAERRVVVSASPEDPARFTRAIATGYPHWIGAVPEFPIRAAARIRHRQEPQPCTVSLRGTASDRSNPAGVHGPRDDFASLVMTAGSDGGLTITFDTPLTGVAPGQAVVLTDGDRVLGGAVIIRGVGDP